MMILFFLFIYAYRNQYLREWRDGLEQIEPDFLLTVYPDAPSAESGNHDHATAMAVIGDKLLQAAVMKTLMPEVDYYRQYFRSHIGRQITDDRATNPIRMIETTEWIQQPLLLAELRQVIFGRENWRIIVQRLMMGDETTYHPSNQFLATIVRAAVAHVMQVDVYAVTSLAHYLVMVAKAQKFALGNSWRLFRTDCLSIEGVDHRNPAIAHCVYTQVWENGGVVRGHDFR